MKVQFKIQTEVRRGRDDAIIPDIVNERQHSTVYVYKAVIPQTAKPEIRAKGTVEHTLVTVKVSINRLTW
jgi:hypothetical protein